MTMHFFTAPRRPADEAERQAEVERYPESAFGSSAVAALIAEAQAIAGTAIAALSIIDGDRQRMFAVTGTDLTELPRAASFCAHAILTPEDVTCVPDLRDDLRFGSNPLVQPDAGLRFYAGVPVVAGNGQPLGVICTADARPRPPLDADTSARLRAVAARIAAELARHRRI